VPAALGTQYAQRMRHIVICGLSGSTIPFHVLTADASRNQANFQAHLRAELRLYIRILGKVWKTDIEENRVKTKML
jgi:hypothetical protein